jgi:hypothetical protein
MRKSIIAPLTLATAIMAFAGPSQAYDSPQGEPAPKKHHKPVHQQPSRTAGTGTTQFRIPAEPAVRDCIHIFFPQCGSRGYGNPNDGSYNRY